MSPGLPEDLIDLATEQLVAESPEERASALTALIATHPEHEASFRALADDLSDVERLLDDKFAEGEFTELEPEVPERIGPYRVLYRLGEGAFGTVFLCEQANPVKRQVAIKVLRPGVGDRQTLARFEAERQHLVQLAHPTIAHVFDAGALPDARPYFVMEYVDGAPIRSYCEAKELTIPERLRLFLELCRGVEHAHIKGIVHRDLKPANVLVVHGIHGPRPMIIDFGIAKALHRTDTGTGMRTETGRIVGTPGYMSPEQALGRTSEVDERSDVFSLGVMLYELLTGELPHMRNAMVLDSEPTRPSSRVAAGTKTKTTGNGTSARRQLVSALRGDLDWITLKALARDRQDRYQNVPALIDDLERHLRGQTVTAGPPSPFYRLRKFTRRNRALVTATTLIFATVITGVLVTRHAGEDAIASIVAAEAEADKKVAAAEAKADGSFESAISAVKALLATASDQGIRSNPGSDILRASILQQAIELGVRLLESRPADPELLSARSTAMTEISQVYAHLGRYKEAESAAEAARVDAETLHTSKPDPLQGNILLAQAHRYKGRALQRMGRINDAHVEFTTATDLLATCHAAKPAQVAILYSAALRELAGTQQHLRQMEPGQRSYQRSVDVLEELLRLDKDAKQAGNDLGFAKFGLAQHLLFQNKHDQAERILTDLSTEPAVDAADLATKVHTLLGRLALIRRDYPVAATQLKSAVEAATRWHQQNQKRVIPMREWGFALELLGTALDRLGSFEEAAQTYRDGIKLAERIVDLFPEDPTAIPDLIGKQYKFAHMLWDRSRKQDLVEAEAFARMAVDNQARIPNTVETSMRTPHWMTLTMLGMVLESCGKTTEADRAWDRVESDLGEAEPSGMLVEALAGIATSQVRNNRDADATRLIQRAKQVIATDPKQYARAFVDIGWFDAQLSARRGDHEAAAAIAEEIIAARSTWLGHHRAGDACFFAWRAAVAASAMESVPNSYADRAVTHYNVVIQQLRKDVEASPDDPWFVLPYGFSSVRLAQIEAARGATQAAHDRLARVLPLLEGAKKNAHADMWDEAAYLEGRRLKGGGVR